MDKFDTPPPLEFQNDVVDSMSQLRAAEYVSAKQAFAQDRATLQLIDDGIQECQTRIARARAQMRSLECQRDAVQRRLAIHRARFSPLRAVPDQILQEIFRHCLPDAPYVVPNVRTAPMVLTHVCRRWRVVAHATSELWLSIALHDRGLWNSELKVDMARRWIDRSRMRPICLSITCPPHTDFGLGGNPMCSDVFRLAIAYAAQLSNVCLNVNSTYLRTFMDRARLPSLRSIIISLHMVHRIDESPQPTTPLLISASDLRCIAFKGNGTSINLIPRAIHPQITHLAFDCNVCLDLALLFRDFPNLEHLALALSFSREALRFVQSDRRVVSPSLLCLEIYLDKDVLHLDEPTQLETVLDQLETPALETLAIIAPVRPQFHTQAGWVGEREQEQEQEAKWICSPSMASFLSRSRCARPRFERRDLAWSSSRNEAWLWRI